MTPEPSDYFDLDERDGVTVVRVAVGVIRHPPQAEQFSRDLVALVERDGQRRLLVDLAECEYLGSTALAALIGLGKRVEAVGGVLALCGFQPEVRTGANIIGMGKMIPIYDDEEAALAAL